jgi:LPS-assembly protein
MGCSVALTASVHRRYHALRSRLQPSPWWCTNSILRNGQRSFAAMQSQPALAAALGALSFPKFKCMAPAIRWTHALSQRPTRGRSFVTHFQFRFSGLIYERDANFFNRNAETNFRAPRLLCSNALSKIKACLPSYDSGATDFNLTTIYSENPYVGQDRIADNNLMTLGVNSRFFDASTGAELARFGLAQRYRFSDQLVRLARRIAR